MDGLLTRFLGGGILNDPLVSKLLLIIIFFLGFKEIVKLARTFWMTGKLKQQAKQDKEKEQQVEEDKGKWKTIVDELVAELKIRNDRADKIYDKVNWLHEVHHKFDDDGVPIWYVRKSLEKVIVKLADSIEKQTDTMGKISGELKEHGFCLHRIDDKVSGKQA